MTKTHMFRVRRLCGFPINPENGEYSHHQFPEQHFRGKRRKLVLEAKPPEAPPAENETAEARVARRAWARLIKKICEVDPLLSPGCSGPMRIISFIEEGEVILKSTSSLTKNIAGQEDLYFFDPARIFFRSPLSSVSSLMISLIVLSENVRSAIVTAGRITSPSSFTSMTTGALGLMPSPSLTSFGTVI